MPRISVSTGARQLEIEGSEEFIAKYEEPLNGMLARLSSDGASDAGSSPPVASAATLSHGAEPGNLEFGEALHLLGSTSGTDQILLAGQYAQDASEDRCFNTGEANQMLIDQGIKLANPSTAMKRNLTSKRVFKIGGKFRVSRAGEDHLVSLLEENGGQVR